MIKICITLKSHLAEYLNGKYLNRDQECVCLPDKLDLYHTIWNLLEKVPVNCRPNLEGNLCLGLPDRRLGKDPAIYNYLGQRSIQIITLRVEALFFGELRSRLDIGKNIHGRRYQDIVYEFKCEYMIDSITDDALLKDFYRWREKIRQRDKRKYLKKTHKK